MKIVAEDALEIHQRERRILAMKIVAENMRFNNMTQFIEYCEVLVNYIEKGAKSDANR